MALISPGVQVSVIDESFYTPAEPGTTPMIFVASKQDKTNAAGTGTARGTTKANAGVPFLITSQRDLSDTFGDPIFQTDVNNNPVNGGELNEYGLQAAYSYLGVSNRAFVARADIDLGEIEPSSSAPAAAPANGTYWFDTALTKFGIFEWKRSLNKYDCLDFLKSHLLGQLMLILQESKFRFFSISTFSANLFLTPLLSIGQF